MRKKGFFTGFSAMVMIQIILIVGSIFIAFKGFNYIRQEGLKNIIESIWEGDK